MKAQFHQEFEALIPLYYAGDLTDEEWALLQIHLDYCDACRANFEQYRNLVKEVIPAMAAAAASGPPYPLSESPKSFAAAEHRLMQSLGAVKPQSSLPKPPFRWRALLFGTAAACAIGALLYTTFQFVHAPHTQSPLATPSRPVSLPAVPQPKVVPQLNGAPGRSDSSPEEDKLRDQLADASKKAASSSAEIATLREQIQKEQDLRQQAEAQRDLLSQQSSTAQASLKILQDKMAANQDRNEQDAAQVSALKSRVLELTARLEDVNESLQNKDKMLALDKDFLAHDRDIRDLMGARNLYIADISDTNANGSTAKPFGRIFYTQDRSLVFYGFDLDKQTGLKQASTFQVWGSGSDQRPVSLGLFYQDDSHKRWVLRFNDATTLSRLNMVFVTTEPPGGSNRPTGKPLLRAYLQIQPNHP